LYGLYLAMRHSASIVYDTFSTVSTVCVTRKWADVDNVWEQRKTQSQKNAPKPRRLPHVRC
jgi:mevalonate pyrophosphate decarboxylase